MQTSFPPQKKSRVKWLLGGIAACIAAYFAFHALHKGPNAGNTQTASTPVSVATVVEKSITDWREFSGILQAVHAVEIRPRIGGQIMNVYFKDGAEVKKGDPLFTIDPRPYEAELARAKGAYAGAESAAGNAKLQYGRAVKLLKTKAISQSEFDTNTSGLKQAEGSLQTAEGAVKAAEVNVAYTHITAPISGKISRAEITEGNLVEAGANAPLLASIVTVSPIYASFDIDEQTFLKTIQGVTAAKLKTIPVEVGLGNEQSAPMKASIHSFDNQLTPGSGTIRVRALLDNKNATLIPGLYARVRIGSPDPVDAILINPTAVATDQSKKFVMVVGEGNKAEYREVTLGSMVDGLQVIASGLKPGEKIIVNGLQRVHPGSVIAGTQVDMTTLKPLDPPAAPPTSGTDTATPPNAASGDKPAGAKPETPDAK